MDSKIIGNFICARRKSMCMTQQQLADILDVTNKAVSKWETGEGYPDITIVPELCKTLSVTADELLAGDTEKHPNGPSVKYGPVNDNCTSDIQGIGIKKRKRKSSTLGSNICIVVGMIFILLIFSTDIFLKTIFIGRVAENSIANINILPLYIFAGVLILIGLVTGTVKRYNEINTK